MTKLKEKSDREKVLIWLQSIGEDDPRCIAEVIEQCAKDVEARKYYLSRYNEIITGI